jgi:transketolase
VFWCSWNTYVVDGHDVEALCRSFYEATTVRDQPTCILAKTLKGKGIAGIEDFEDWHGKPIGPVKTEAALSAIHGRITNPGPHGLHPRLPTEVVAEIPFGGILMSEPPTYKLGDKVCFDYGVVSLTNFLIPSLHHY